MRILQIVPSISLVYGGPSQMILGLSKALADAGIEVTILTTNSNGDVGQPPLDVPLGKPVRQDGYEIVYFPCFPFRRYKFSFDSLRWLIDRARDYNLAHIHALFSPFSTAAATVARSCQLPYILRPLGTLDPADLQKKRTLKKIYGFLLERPNLRKASAIHFTSQLESEVSERYGVETHDLVIPLGVNFPEKLPPWGSCRQLLGIDESVPMILFLSRIEPKKGIELLISSLEIILEKKIDYHFVLAGSNPQDPDFENYIKRKIEASKIADRTTIAGFVRGELKTGLLQDADLFVLPSYYENFGIAVAEAMVLGTPVVISDRVYIWPDVDGASAGWVTPCEVEPLAETLMVSLQDAGARKQRGANARRLALTQYSWSAIAKQMIRAYQLYSRPELDPGRRQEGRVPH